MEDLRQWWEIPSIGQFVSLFRFAFNLPEINIEDLEKNLAADDSVEGYAFIANLLIALLKGLYPRRLVTLSNWETYLERILERKWVRSDKRKNPLSETVGFSQLKLRTKVEIIYCLCLYRLDCDDVAKAMKSMDAEALRVQSLGTDDRGNVYWYFYGTRLYKEEPSPLSKSKQEWKECIAKDQSKTMPLKRGRGRPRKNVPIKSDGESDESEGNNGEKSYLTLDSKSRWSVVCTTLEEWKSFASQFKTSKSKNEISLFKIVNQNFLPVLTEMYEKKSEQVRALLEASPKNSLPRMGFRKRKCLNSNSTTKESERRKRRKESVDHDDELDRRIKEIEDENFASNHFVQNDEVKSDDVKEVSSTSSPSNVYAMDKNLSYEPELLFKLRKVLSAVKLHKDAWPFLLPVDEVLAPDYYNIIKDPVDLSAIERKVELKVYNSVWQIEADFQKLVSNCRLYNGEESAYTSMAKTVWRVFRKGIAQFVQLPNSSSQSSDDDKIELSVVEKSDKAVNESSKPLRKSRILSRKRKNNRMQTIEGLNMLADASEQALKEVGLTEGELFMDNTPDMSSKSKSFPDLKVVTIQNHPPSFIAKWKRSSLSSRESSDETSSKASSPCSLKSNISSASDNSMDAPSPPSLNRAGSSLSVSESSRDSASPISQQMNTNVSSVSTRSKRDVSTSPVRSEMNESSALRSMNSSPGSVGSMNSSPASVRSMNSSPASMGSRDASPASIESTNSLKSRSNSPDDINRLRQENSSAVMESRDDMSSASMNSGNDAYLTLANSRSNSSFVSNNSQNNASPTLLKSPTPDILEKISPADSKIDSIITDEKKLRSNSCHSDDSISSKVDCSVRAYSSVNDIDQVSDANKSYDVEKPISPDSCSVIIIRGSSPLSDGSSQGSSKSLQELTDNYHVLDLPLDITKTDGLCNVNISSLLYKIIKENHVLSSSDTSDVETPLDNMGPNETTESTDDVHPSDSLGPPVLELSVQSDHHVDDIVDSKSPMPIGEENSNTTSSPPQLDPSNNFLGLSPINDIRTVDATEIGISTVNHKNCPSGNIIPHNTNSIEIHDIRDSKTHSESREKAITASSPILYTFESNAGSSSLAEESPYSYKEGKLDGINREISAEQKTSEKLSCPFQDADDSANITSNSVNFAETDKLEITTTPSETRAYSNFEMTRLNESHYNSSVTSQLPLQVPVLLPQMSLPRISPNSELNSFSSNFHGPSVYLTPSSQSASESAEDHAKCQSSFNLPLTISSSTNIIDKNLPDKLISNYSKNMAAKKDSSPRHIKKKKRSIAIIHNQQAGNLTSSTNITSKTVYSSVSASETEPAVQQFVPVENSAMFKLSNLVSNTHMRLNEEPKPGSAVSPPVDNSKSSVFMPYISNAKLDSNQVSNFWSEKAKTNNFASFPVSNSFYTFSPANYVNAAASFTNSNNFAIMNRRPQTFMTSAVTQPITYNSIASSDIKSSSVPTMSSNTFTTPVQSLQGFSPTSQQISARTFSPDNLQNMQSQKPNDGLFQTYGIQNPQIIHNISPPQRLSQPFMNIAPSSYILPVQPSALMTSSLFPNVIVNSMGTNSTNMNDVRPQFSVSRSMPVYTILPNMPSKLM